MALGTAGAGGHIFTEAHSQGGLILDRALKGIDHPSRTTASQLKRIDAITLGSAKIISNPKLGSVTNIVDRRDPVTAIADSFNYWSARFGITNDVQWVGSAFGNPFAAHERQQDEYQNSLSVVEKNISDRRRRGL